MYKPMMFEQIMIEQCSPTMAGLKTGNLFVCPYENKCKLNCNIRKLNMLAVPKGVRIVPLKFSKNRALIYMYRPEKLAHDLKDPLAAQILDERDYPVCDTELCVSEMLRRLREEEEFPHEVGLFLGYPPEDVHGFMTYGPHGAKCVGTWRVYGDEEKAKERFALYKKCTEHYLKAYRKNASFDKLVVKSTKNAK